MKYEISKVPALLYRINIENLKMNIDDLTFGELKQIAALFSDSIQNGQSDLSTKSSIQAEFPYQVEILKQFLEEIKCIQP